MCVESSEREVFVRVLDDDKAAAEGQPPVFKVWLRNHFARMNSMVEVWSGSGEAGPFL